MQSKTIIKMIESCPVNVANKILIDFSAETIEDYFNNPNSFSENSTVPIVKPWNASTTSVDDLIADLAGAIDSGTPEEILVFAARLAAKRKLFGE